MTVRVSVVVPTCRRPELLDRCLAALVRQDLDRSEYEVIVVDDARNLRTKEVVEQWRELAQLRYMQTPASRGPAAARNAGWKVARGEIIAFTDDDCVPEPGWLREGLAGFIDGVIGCWGKTVVPLPPVPTDYEFSASWLQTAEFVTANCFYRRGAIAGVGGFDERFTAAWREDSDLHFRLAEVGRLAEAPGAVVVHPVRKASWAISLKQQRKNVFNALLYKKHPRLYREKVQSSPPWHYYSIVAALLAGAGFGLTGRPLPTLAAGAVWGLLTGRFCLHRLAGTSHAPAHVAEMVVTSVLIPPLAVFWRLVGAARYRVWFL